MIKYEIEHDLYKISPKNRYAALLRFFKNLKNLGFIRNHFPALATNKLQSEGLQKEDNSPTYAPIWEYATWCKNTTAY